MGRKNRMKAKKEEKVGEKAKKVQNSSEVKIGKEIIEKKYRMRSAEC